MALLLPSLIMEKRSRRCWRLSGKKKIIPHKRSHCSTTHTRQCREKRGWRKSVNAAHLNAMCALFRSFYTHNDWPFSDNDHWSYTDTDICLHPRYIEESRPYAWKNLLKKLRNVHSCRQARDVQLHWPCTSNVSCELHFMSLDLIELPSRCLNRRLEPNVSLTSVVWTPFFRHLWTHYTLCTVVHPTTNQNWRREEFAAKLRQ